MVTIIEAFAKYQKHLQNDRQCKPGTIRSISLSISYFLALYSTKEIAEITAGDLKIFFEYLQRKKKEKCDKFGNRQTFSKSFVHKVMKHIKAFVKWR
jgi:site-specific recombinase XerD